MLNQVMIKRLDERIGQSHPLPTYQTDGAAGIDLYAAIEEDLILKPNACELIPSGIAIYIQDDRYCAVIAPRSGLGHKQGIVLGNLLGVIDADYQGEIKISIWNRSETAYTIKPMDRVAQLLFLPIEKPRFEVVDDFKTSSRGEGGFGSSGR